MKQANGVDIVISPATQVSCIFFILRRSVDVDVDVDVDGVWFIGLIGLIG